MTPILSRSALIILDLIDDGKRLVGCEGTLALIMGSACSRGPVRLALGIAVLSPSTPIVRAADALGIFVIRGGEITLRPSSRGMSI